MGRLRRRSRAVTIGILVIGMPLWTSGANAAAGDEAVGENAQPVVQDATQAPGDPVGIALDHLRDSPGEFGVSGADVADLAVASSYRSSHNGVTHVNVNQRLDGLEVFGAYATVNVVGKEGVGGSSPPEGFFEVPAKRPF